VNVECGTIDAMGDAYGLIRVAIPDVATTAQEKCPAAMEAALDLTRLGKRFLGANVRLQFPNKDLSRPPILDSYKRSTDCRDLGNVFAGQLGISCMYRSESKPHTSRGKQRKRGMR
jgi:hypothetical protein